MRFILNLTPQNAELWRERWYDGMVMNYMVAGGIWLWHVGRTYPAVSLEQDWRTYGTGAQKCTRKTSLARGIHCCPISFNSFARPASLYCDTHTHTHTHTQLTAYRMYMNYLSYQITMRMKLFTQTGNSTKCWLDIYHWDAGLSLTGRIRDTGKNFYRLIFKQEAVAAAFTAKFSSLSHSSRRTLFINIIHYITNSL